MSLPHLTALGNINKYLTTDVAIQAYTVATNTTYGDRTISWATSSTVKGRKSQFKSGELTELRKIYPDINTKWFLKKGSVVATNNRLLVGGLHYDVLEVRDPVTAGEFIIVFTKSGAE